MTKTDDPYDPNNLAIDPEQIARAQPGNGQRPIARTFKARFAKFPMEVLQKVIRATGSAELAVLTELYERHFSDYGNNPVKISTSALSEKYGITRWKMAGFEGFGSRGHHFCSKTWKEKPVCDA